MNKRPCNDEADAPAAKRARRPAFVADPNVLLKAIDDRSRVDGQISPVLLRYTRKVLSYMMLVLRLHGILEVTQAVERMLRAASLLAGQDDPVVRARINLDPGLYPGTRAWCRVLMRRDLRHHNAESSPVTMDEAYATCVVLLMLRAMGRVAACAQLNLLVTFVRVVAAADDKEAVAAIIGAGLDEFSLHDHLCSLLPIVATKQ